MGYDDHPHPLAKTGLRSEAILARINSGWSAEDALTRQVRHTDFVPKAVA